MRSLVDRLVAAVAIRDGAAVLEKNRDFGVIAAHSELRLHRVGGGSDGSPGEAPEQPEPV